MIDLAWTEAMRIDLVKAWAAWVMFCVACGCTLAMYWGFLPQTAALLWSSWVALFLLVWAGWNVQFGFQPPDTANLRKIWWPRTQAIVLMSNAIVVATVWLFLPNGGRDEMLMMLVFYMAMIPTQILTSPENSASIRLGTAALFGSILLYLMQHPTPLRDSLLVFVSVYGAVMFSFSSAQGELVKKAVQSDVKNRKLVHQLDKSIESLRLAQASKTQFIETASHDLLQPLQASRLYLNAVLHAPQVIQRELAAQGMQRAITSVETQLAHMIQGLHLHGEGGLELSSELLDIGEVMTRVAEQFHLSARERKIDITVRPSRLKGWLDRTLLHRALSNIVDNAIKHSRARRILVACRKTAEGRLRIWILDDGVGIPAQEARLIFDNHFRGAAIRTTQVSGFGLGLASVQHMAKQLGGTVGLEQRWIRGAAFYMELPGLPVNEPRRSLVAPRGGS